MSLQVLAFILGILAVLAWKGHIGGNPFVWGRSARDLIILASQKAEQEAASSELDKKVDEVVKTLGKLRSQGPDVPKGGA